MRALVFLLSVLIGSCTTDFPAEKDVQEAVVTAHKLKYLLYLPDDYESRDSWPLILFLHGAGERGDSLELVKIHGPPKLIAEGKKFPLIVVSPQVPQDEWWKPEVVLDLLDFLEDKYRVDQTRIYLTGLSMGGFGTWQAAVQNPNRFAAIAPVCGGGDPALATRIASLPVWAFHGADDKVVPVGRSTEMIEAITKAGGTPRLTVYPDTGHDSWTETYNNPALYEWFLQH